MRQETRDYKDLIKLAIVGMLLMFVAVGCGTDSTTFTEIPGQAGPAGAPGEQGPAGADAVLPDLTGLQQAVALLQAQVIVLQDALCLGSEHAHRGCR